MINKSLSLIAGSRRPQCRRYPLQSIQYTVPFPMWDIIARHQSNKKVEKN